MKKYFNNLFIWQVSGGGIIFFIVSPLLLAIYQYEFSDHQIPFLQNLSHIYIVLIPPRDIDVIILNIVISIVGIIMGTLLYRYKHRTTSNELTTKMLTDLIATGENNQVEFKSSFRHDYRQMKTNKNLEDVILKSIAGFLNSKGGILIIGVNDQGETLGLANDYWSLKIRTKDGFEQRLILVISNAFGKDICSKIQISFHQINDKEICSLLIDSSQRPVYFNENNQTTFYLRTGNVTNPLSTSETVDYLVSKFA